MVFKRALGGYTGFISGRTLIWLNTHERGVCVPCKLSPLFLHSSVCSGNAAWASTHVPSLGSPSVLGIFLAGCMSISMETSLFFD